MNPPDEHQTASTRSPFISAGRRTAAVEDNILARLERDARRGRPGMRWKNSWIAWCSVASLVIIGLIGVLTSLARENIERHAPMVAAATMPASDPYATPPTSANTGFAPLPLLTTPAKQPAAIIDMRADRTVIKADDSARPPLVMLKPTRTPARPAPAPTPRIAAAKPVASKAVAAKPPAIAPRKTVAASTARPRKASVPAAAPEPAVDSDVALLSAIILHASRHADERAQLEAARCGAGKKCAPTPDPLPSLKATD